MINIHVFTDTNMINIHVFTDTIIINIHVFVHIIFSYSGRLYFANVDQ